MPQALGWDRDLYMERLLDCEERAVDGRVAGQFERLEIILAILEWSTPLGGSFRRLEQKRLDWNRQWMQAQQEEKNPWKPAGFDDEIESAGEKI